jgi:cytochrome c oxidase subunit 3
MSSTKQQHPFHLVELSPWPILTAFSLFFLTIGTTMVMHEHKGGEYITIFGILSIICCASLWWRDVINEGVNNHHTNKVQTGLRIGMSLFILSEVMFFFAFFFSFFFSSLFPAGILDGIWVVAEGIWPPKNIRTFDPWDIPFINTLILLLSGTTVTWAHHAIEHNEQKNSVTALALTIFLGISFTFLQAYEYHHAAFGLQDGVYAANFYLATGFHGLHIIVGTIFLIVSFFRAKRGDFINGKGYLGFEFAAWYWHFVDVVWLFLFVFVYVL